MRKKSLFIFINILIASSFSYSQNINEISTSTNTVSTSTVFVATTTTESISSQQMIFENKYVQIIDSCKFNFFGACVSVRNLPSKKGKKLFGARNGIVLKVSEKITNVEGDWYKIIFDEKLIYSERVKGDMYVFAKYAIETRSVMPETYDETKIYDESKSIVVDLSEQKLYAYQNTKIFMETKVSTGLGDTPTIPNEYYIFYKTPSRYMQGPTDRKGLIKKYTSNLYNSTTIATSTRDYLLNTKAYTTDTSVKDYYDLPGVPYTMYFDSDGSAIHGAYWHNNFGQHHSHGCINLSIKDSEKLYRWAGVGTSVIIRK